jgi:GT2 family glycosyltransferase
MKSVVFTTNTWESPLGFLRFGGPYELAGIQMIPGGDPDTLSRDLISRADVVVVQRDFPRRRKIYAQVIAQAKEQGKPVIFELDDLLFELPEDHPDVQSGYYVETVVPMISALIQADAVTVSTPRLAGYVRAVNPNVHLLPNYLNDTLWRMKPPEKWTGDRPVVIGYMGGPSHLPDLQMVAPALKNVLKRYENRVVVRLVGTNPPEDLLSEAGVSWEGAPTYVYRDFASHFTSRNIDIAVAPLRDNLFNRCKSAIKFLEYTAAGAAGIYSDLDTYRTAVLHEKTGFLAESLEAWEENLSKLVESSNRRAEMVQLAQEAVRKDWLLSGHFQEWQDVYQKIAAAGRKPDAGQHPLERMLGRVQEWQDRRASKEGLESAQVYEMTQAMNKIRADAQAEIEQLEMETSKMRLERDTADAWVKGVLDSRTWKMIQAGNKFIPSAIRPLKAIPAELLKRVMENRWFDQTAQPGKNGPAPIKLAAEGAIPSAYQYDVVLFSIMNWETRTQRPQQMALQFAAKGHRVFFVQTSFAPSGPPHVTQAAQNLWVIVLPLTQQPNIYRDSLDESMVQALANAVEQLREQFHIHQAVSLVDLPFWYPIAKHLRETLGWKIVYDCMDYHAGFSTTQSPVLELEDTLVREADLVLATSHLLKTNVSKLNENCILVPNGADFDHFHFAPPNLPEEIIGLHGPVIGYYGAIADWFDTRLLRYLALARPSWHFLLIGSTLYSDMEPIQGIDNIFLLGEKPYRTLPGYLHRFNAAIIPFKKTPLTDATNPVKLFEYMSAGKPVVATDLEELRNYADQVCLASTTDEWIAGLESALHESPGESLNRRYEFARQNTWERRIEVVREGIASLYPKISIVVLTYNNKDFTRLCLDSIFLKTGYPNFEVIVVDNASIDGTQEMLKAYEKENSNLKVILNQNNEGFARGNNIGAQAASGDVIVFLNNDTVVTPGWLEGLQRHLQDPQIGMVGPVTSFSGNESRIPVDYVTLDEMDAFAEKYTSAHRGESFDIGILAFLCVAMRREVWEDVGGLDELFGVGMFEDDDYAIRVKEKGYRIVCAEDVFIHHAGAASFSKLDQSYYQMLFEKNRIKFEKKWGRPWQPHLYRDQKPEEDGS